MILLLLAVFLAVLCEGTSKIVFDGFCWLISSICLYLDTTGQNDLCPKFTNDYGAFNCFHVFGPQAFFARAFSCFLLFHNLYCN